MADDISMPLASEALTNPDFTAAASWYRIFANWAQAFNGNAKDVAADLATRALKAQIGLPAAWTFKFPEDETVVLIQNSPTVFTITASTCITEVGTSTVTLKKNGVAISGSANSASTSEGNISHFDDFAAGDDLSVTFSSTSVDCENLNLTLALNITLD